MTPICLRRKAHDDERGGQGHAKPHGDKDVAAFPATTSGKPRNSSVMSNRGCTIREWIATRRRAKIQARIPQARISWDVEASCLKLWPPVNWSKSTSLVRKHWFGLSQSGRRGV